MINNLPHRCCVEEIKFTPDRTKIIQNMINKLLTVRFSEEVMHLEWLANVVFVSKKGGQVETLCRFHKLEQALPKGQLSFA